MDFVVRQSSLPQQKANIMQTPYKHLKKDPMSVAHRATKQMMIKHGGNHSEYFSKCLKDAHADFKRDNQQVLTINFTQLLSESIASVMVFTLVAIMSSVFINSEMYVISTVMLLVAGAMSGSILYVAVTQNINKLKRRFNKGSLYGTVIYSYS